MQYRLYGINHKDIDTVWDECVPILEKALKRTGDFEKEDIHSCLEDRNMQLWVIKNEDDVIKCAFVTQIEIYPNKRVLSIPYLGGEYAKEWIHYLEAIEEYGRYNQCDYIILFNRKGWSKYFKDSDYKEKYIAYTKEL